MGYDPITPNKPRPRWPRAFVEIRGEHPLWGAQGRFVASPIHLRLEDGPGPR